MTATNDVQEEAGATPVLPLVPKQWQAGFKSKRGQVTPTLANAVLILQRDPEWLGVLGYDELAGRVQVLRTPPGHSVDGGRLPVPGDYWTDLDTARAAAWCERLHQIAFSHEVFMQAVEISANSRAVHPVRKYLEGLRWDGKKRIDSWLTTYFRVKPTDYTAMVGWKWLVSAVARTYNPGCKVDTVLVLEGGQGAGKTYGIRALCPDERWFLETTEELGTKDARQVIRSKWIVELAELDSLSRAEMSRVKAFISTQVDTYRPSYGRVVRDYPRCVVFIGTTNERHYLKDATGGRRWWPVQTEATATSPIDFRAIERDRDQLWAEAVVRFREGNAWHLEGREAIAAAGTEQEDRRQEDPLEDAIRAYISKRTVKGVTISDVLAQLGYEPLKTTTADSMRVGRILRLLGWELAGRSSRGGSRIRVYFPNGVYPLPQATKTDKADGEKV